MQVAGNQKHILNWLSLLAIVVIALCGQRCIAAQENGQTPFSIGDVIAFVKSEYARQDSLDKTVLAESVSQEFGLEKKRSVYVLSLIHI